MPDLTKPSPSAAASLQAACLASLGIRLPLDAAEEFCRLSEELERLRTVSGSGLPVPVNVKEFQSLWRDMTREELSEVDAEDYGRRTVIIFVHKKRRELEARLRMILVRHRETPVED